MTISLLAVIAAGIVSALGTGMIRNYAVRNDVLDRPNERSSHTTPTPRGGGLAVVAIVLVAVVALVISGLLSLRVGVAFGVGGLAVALIGWLDDHRPLPAGTRALVHVAAAIWAVYWTGGLRELDLGAGSLTLGFGGNVLAVLGVAWLINLFNFMDGIDGLAGAEALAVGGIGASLLALGGNHGLALLSAVVAAAAFGFLCWNWAPARIFMGDVGSGFLGFAFAVLALASEAADGPPLLVWLLLLGAFIVDATLTVMRRVVRGEPWYAAHRRHAYQRLVQAGYSHRQVTTWILALNLGLGALAWLAVGRGSVAAELGLGFALVFACYLAVDQIRPMWEDPNAASNRASAGP